MGLPEKSLPKYKEGLWLTKDNKLIMMVGNMTAMTYKITNYFLREATIVGIDEYLSVSAATIVKACGIKNGSYSEVLRVEADKVMSTKIEIQSKKTDEWEKVNLISKMKYEKGYLMAKVNPDIKDYIIGLANNFTNTNYAIVNKCKTYAAMKLYEVCFSWKRKGLACYNVDTWQKLLGAGNTYNNKYSEFKRWILMPAIKTVNENTDLCITPEFIKDGRKVSIIKMHIVPHDNVLESVEEVVDAEPVGEGSVTNQENSLGDYYDIVKIMIKTYGFAKEKAEQLVQRYGGKYCRAQMDYVRNISKKRAMENPGGYLIKAIEQDFAGSRQIQVEAAKAEQAERADKALWDKQAKEFFAVSEEETDLVDKLIQKHEEVAQLYLDMGLPKEQVARWIEKYPEVLLFKIGVRLQSENGLTADYVEQVLKHNA